MPRALARPYKNAATIPAKKIGWRLRFAGAFRLLPRRAADHAYGLSFGWRYFKLRS